MGLDLDWKSFARSINGLNRSCSFFEIVTKISVGKKISYTNYSATPKPVAIDFFNTQKLLAGADCSCIIFTIDLDIVSG